MNKIKKAIVALGLAAMVAVPATALATDPQEQYSWGILVSGGYYPSPASQSVNMNQAIYGPFSLDCGTYQVKVNRWRSGVGWESFGPWTKNCNQGIQGQYFAVPGRLQVSIDATSSIYTSWGAGVTYQDTP